MGHFFPFCPWNFGFLNSKEGIKSFIRSLLNVDFFLGFGGFEIVKKKLSTKTKTMEMKKDPLPINVFGAFSPFLKKENLGKKKGFFLILPKTPLKKVLKLFFFLTP